MTGLIHCLCAAVGCRRSKNVPANETAPRKLAPEITADALEGDPVSCEVSCLTWCQRMCLRSLTLHWGSTVVLAHSWGLAGGGGAVHLGSISRAWDIPTSVCARACQVQAAMLT